MSDKKALSVRLRAGLEGGDKYDDDQYAGKQVRLFGQFIIQADGWDDNIIEQLRGFVISHKGSAYMDASEYFERLARLIRGEGADD